MSKNKTVKEGIKGWRSSGGSLWCCPAVYSWKRLSSLCLVVGLGKGRCRRNINKDVMGIISSGGRIGEEELEGRMSQIIVKIGTCRLREVLRE